MKDIVLNNGYISQVDDDDYELVSQYKWYAKISYGQAYAYTSSIKGKRTQMHRLIVMSHPDIFGNIEGLVVDHINRNSLCNVKTNLRLCTDAENHYNAKRRKDSSWYKGVSYNKNRKRFFAQISFKKTHYRLGTFDNPEDAAKMYDRAAIDLFGKFASTNFPRESYLPEECIGIVRQKRRKTSLYRGVSFFKESSKWRAAIVINDNQKHIGLFESETEAAIAYDQKARELHGELAKTNF